MGPIQSYRDLNVWKDSMDLAVHCTKLSRSFPQYELFGLTSQISRAACSIPANIAEGQARDSTKEFIRYLSISRGSLAELETHLELATRLEYISREQLDALLQSIGKMLSALRKSLKRRITKP